MARGDQVVCRGRPLDRAGPTTWPRLGGEPALRASSCADVSEAIRGRGPGRRRLHLASPASPPDYLARPLETLAVGSEGTRRALDLAARPRRPLPPGVDQRGLRRPASCTPSPRRTGATSIRSGPAASTTRPSASPRRSPWPTHRTYGRRRRIVRIFNTYGPRPAARRRAGGVQLPRPGPRGPAPHRLRRRHPDPQPLLRGRRGGRDPGPARLEVTGPGEHRQPRRVHRARAGPRSSSSSPARRRRSCTSRCPTDDPTGAAPTSRVARRSSGGSRRRPARGSCADRRVSSPPA